MKIDLNKKEYKTLLELLYVANWVLHAHEEDENPETQPYRDLEQKILALAQDENLVVWDEDLKKHFFAEEFDETPAMDFIEQFENDTFWSELMERLSERDFISKFGEEAFLKMEPEERLKKLDEFMAKYSSEFEKNGVDNLRIG